LHSRQYFQCAFLLQHTEIAAKVCGWLADKLQNFASDAVISLPWAGSFRSRGRARAGETAHFVEKEVSGPPGLRHGFK
jgi:orotate phosphoribosyltransferase